MAFSHLWSRFGLFLLLTIGAIGLLAWWLPWTTSARLTLGAIFILWLPGFWWSKVIWSDERISGLERFIVSIILSVLLVPTGIFLASVVGLPVITPVSIGVALVLIVSGYSVVSWRQRRTPTHRRPSQLMQS